MEETKKFFLPLTNLQHFATTIPDAGNVVLGEGAFYLNYDSATTPPAGSNILVGATRGGSFNFTPEYKDLEFDGKRGPVKGFKRIIGWNVTFTINVLEFANSLTIDKIYAALERDITNVEYDIVKGKKQISEDDYLTNVAFVGETQTGEEVIIIVKNALGDGAVEAALEDKEEVVPEVTFTGHADPADIATPPFEIRYPKSA